MLDGDLTDFITLPHLIRWLKTKNPDDKYLFLDCGNCLIHQFLVASGIAISPTHGVSGFCWHGVDGVEHLFPQYFAGIAQGVQRTFGAALVRAEEALAST